MTHLSKRLDRLEAQRGSDAVAWPSVILIAEASGEAHVALFLRVRTHNQKMTVAAMQIAEATWIILLSPLNHDSFADGINRSMSAVRDKPDIRQKLQDDGREPNADMALRP